MNSSRSGVGSMLWPRLGAMVLCRLRYTEKMRSYREWSAGFRRMMCRRVRLCRSKQRQSWRGEE